MDRPQLAMGWRLEVRGTEVVLFAETPAMPQISPVVLSGARLGEERKPIRTREGRNLAESYAAMARAIREGTRHRADFADALALHWLLENIRTGKARGERP